MWPFSGHGLEHDRVDDLLPAVLRGEGIEIAQQAVLDELVELLAGVELHGVRRVAADDAVDAVGACRVAAAAGHRRVDPLAALRIEGLLELRDGRVLAAGGPPMDDLGLLGGCCRTRKHGNRCAGQSPLDDGTHLNSSQLKRYCKTVRKTI